MWARSGDVLGQSGLCSRVATTMLATGIAVATLTNVGAFGRPAFTVGGTGASIKFQAWFVGKW
jgi:hypothetical protein